MIKKQLRKLKFLLIRLLRIKDNAHSIAIGFTIGFLINFVPSFGIGPLLSAISAKLLRGNSFAGFIGGISFLWAFPLLFYLNIVVGENLFPIELFNIGGGIEDTEEALVVGLQIGKAFFIGMLINMLLFGSSMYFISYTILKRYRYDLLMFIYRKWGI